MRDREDKTPFGQFNKWLAVIAALIGIATATGGWFVMPYKLAAEEANRIKLEARVDAMEKSQAVNNELLVRIDERLKSVQDRLHIPDGNK